MARARAERVTPIKAKPGKKCHIKILPPSGSQFKDTTGINTIRDTPNGISWTATKLRSSSRTKLKFSIKVDNRDYVDVDLPDAGTVTITLSDPPIDINPDVEPLDVDYVDEVDAP